MRDLDDTPLRSEEEREEEKAMSSCGLSVLVGLVALAFLLIGLEMILYAQGLGIAMGLGIIITMGLLVTGFMLCSKSQS